VYSIRYLIFVSNLKFQEFMEHGSLHSALKKGQGKDIAQKRKWMREIAAGMFHLHCVDIIHR
jgi:hypothetical protein